MDDGVELTSVRKAFDLNGDGRKDRVACTVGTATTPTISPPPFKPAPDRGHPL
jgi:hypothetical protein